MRACAVALSVLAACASVGRSSTDASFHEGSVLEVFVRWREGERRRDVEMAQEALYFESSSDRAFHREDLEALSGVFAGPIRTAREIHLVGRPEPLGPGDYLFVEPAGGAHTATFVTIVAVNGEPRILYRRPAVSQEQRRAMRPEDVTRLRAAERIAFWESLGGERLAKEIERTKRMLRYEVEAERFARENAIPLRPFSPKPGEVLRVLEPLPHAEVREWIVASLRGASGPGRS